MAIAAGVLKRADAVDIFAALESEAWYGGGPGAGAGMPITEVLHPGCDILDPTRVNAPTFERHRAQTFP